MGNCLSVSPSLSPKFTPYSVASNKRKQLQFEKKVDTIHLNETCQIQSNQQYPLADSWKKRKSLSFIHSLSLFGEILSSPAPSTPLSAVFQTQNPNQNQNPNVYENITRDNENIFEFEEDMEENQNQEEEEEEEKICIPGRSLLHQSKKDEFALFHWKQIEENNRSVFYLLRQSQTTNR